MTALTSSTSVTIDLGAQRSFLAWATVSMIDSLSSFDRDNAIAAEVYAIDGVRTTAIVSGGDHWGTSGSTTNLRPGAWVGFGRRITYRLRVFHVSDLAASGEAIVLTL
jgi:hypothetical protein